MSPIEVLAEMDRLLDRALIIADGLPYHKSTDNTEWATLAITDDKAILSWPETEWDSSSISANTLEFPARLLGLDAGEFAAWQAEQKAIHKRECEKARQQELKRQAEIAADKERQERYLYEELRQKYSSKE